MSRQDAEALGIQLDPVEQPVDGQQDEAATAEDPLEGMTEQENQIQESEMQQQEELSEYHSENQELDSEFHRELQAGIQSELHSKSQEAAVEPPEINEPEVEAVPPTISVPEDVLPIETEEEKVKEQAVAKEEEDTQTTTVSLDAVSQQLAGDDGGDGDSSANDVLSNIIQSLFNPNEPNQSNVSIVPRMVGGKRKLCLRLPASTASALLAQTGSPLATSFTEGGIPKKIKIVIPPNSMSSSAGIVSSLTNSAIAQENKVIKMSMAQGGHAGKTTGPARLDPDTLPSSSSMSLLSSPAKSSSKPFLASLFSSTNSSPSPSVTVTPVSQPQQHSQQPKKPLGSTENPIQLVQEGNSFRSLQPLTPDQLKHIASVLKQNRQAILSGTGDSKAGNVSAGTDGEGGKRRVVYDAASNTRIVYRVVTPGELKKSPAVSGGSGGSAATVLKSSTISTTATAASGVRGRGRGRGRPPRTPTVFAQARKPSPEESDSEDLGEEETSLGANIDMSKVTVLCVMNHS